MIAATVSTTAMVIRRVTTATMTTTILVLTPGQKGIMMRMAALGMGTIAMAESAWHWGTVTATVKVPIKG